MAENKETIVVGIEDLFDDALIHAFFFMTKGSRRNAFCASISARPPVTETMIWGTANRLNKNELLSYKNGSVVWHHKERDFKGMLKTLLNDIEEFTKKKPVCVLFDMPPAMYKKIEFTPDGINLTTSIATTKEWAMTADKFIDIYGGIHGHKEWPRWPHMLKGGDKNDRYDKS